MLTLEIATMPGRKSDERESKSDAKKVGRPRKRGGQIWVEELQHKQLTELAEHKGMSIAEMIAPILEPFIEVEMIAMYLDKQVAIAKKLSEVDGSTMSKAEKIRKRNQSGPPS